MHFPLSRLRSLSSVLVANHLLAATGETPLTLDLVFKAAAFFEWVLDVRFSAAQQQEYENLLAREWPNPANRKSLVEMVHGLDRLSSVPEEKKRQLHDQIQQTMLESMHKNSQSEDSRWLLAVYDSAHERSVTEGSVPVAAGRIYGKWRESKASSVQYGNRTPEHLRRPTAALTSTNSLPTARTNMTASCR